MLNSFERTGVASVVLHDAQDNETARQRSNSKRGSAMDSKARRISRTKARWRTWNHGVVAWVGTIERHCEHLASIEVNLWVKVRPYGGGICDQKNSCKDRYNP